MAKRLKILRIPPGDPQGTRGRELRSAAQAGMLRRLIPGRFVVTADWEGSTPEERHRARIRAVLDRAAPHIVISHASAAAMHDLPWIGEFPDRVTATDVGRSNGQKRVYLSRVPGAGRSIGTVIVDGILVTSLVVTAVDVALRESRQRAIVVLDAVLKRGVTREQLTRELFARTNPRAYLRAQELIALANGLSGSAGESIARLLMHDLGLPVPVLQQTFTDSEGFVGQVDFWFPEQGVIVEFDGRLKVEQAEFRNGRTPERVVFDEKRREDRLRAIRVVNNVIRLYWADVMPDGAAPRKLRSGGLPVSR